MLKVATWSVWILACLVSMAAALGCGAQERIEDDSRARDVVGQYETLVLVEVLCDDGRMFAGSGTVLDGARVLTAAHLVRCSAVLITAQQVATMDESVVVRVEATEGDADIARLAAPDNAYPFVLRAPPRIGEAPILGERVCAVSAVPFVARRCGQVQPSTRARIYHDGFTEPGNSGGPVYDDAGRLVGITSRYMTCSDGQICGGVAATLSGHAIVFVGGGS